jgi:methionyl aminopeptidase
MVELKSRAEIDVMRAAGRVVAQTLAAVREAAAPGVSLLELDALAAMAMRAAGATPSFLGYHPGFAPTPFPGVLCTSVNDVVVHGIPDGYRLRDGDLLSVDCGAKLNGFHGDAAITLIVGSGSEADSEADQRLIAATNEALHAGIAAAWPGNRLGDIGAAIAVIGRKAGYGLHHNFGGHGIGREMHEAPDVPNDGRPGRGMRLRPGLVIAIEPMFMAGGHDTYDVAADGWAMHTIDGSRAAHIEHTVAVTEDGPLILTEA